MEDQIRSSEKRLKIDPRINRGTVIFDTYTTTQRLKTKISVVQGLELTLYRVTGGL